jgi:hypothetical protein
LWHFVAFCGLLWLFVAFCGQSHALGSSGKIEVFCEVIWSRPLDCEQRKNREMSLCCSSRWCCNSRRSPHYPLPPPIGLHCCLYCHGMLSNRSMITLKWPLHHVRCEVTRAIDTPATVFPSIASVRACLCHLVNRMALNHPISWSTLSLLLVLGDWEPLSFQVQTSLRRVYLLVQGGGALYSHACGIQE